MKPFLVLLASFGISLLVQKLIFGSYQFAFSGQVAMSVMLLFTALAHFVFTKGMVMMVPDFIPYKRQMVYFTGLMEIAAATGLFIPELKVLTAWMLILFFILMLPSNILAAVRKIDYQKGTLDGSGPAYLWFRVPLQILFIGWTYLSCIAF